VCVYLWMKERDRETERLKKRVVNLIHCPTFQHAGGDRSGVARTMWKRGDA